MNLNIFQAKYPALEEQSFGVARLCGLCGLTEEEFRPMAKKYKLSIQTDRKYPGGLVTENIARKDAVDFIDKYNASVREQAEKSAAAARKKRAAESDYQDRQVELKLRMLEKAAARRQAFDGLAAGSNV